MLHIEEVQREIDKLHHSQKRTLLFAVPEVSFERFDVDIVTFVNACFLTFECSHVHVHRGHA